jgi:regulatory protein
LGQRDRSRCALAARLVQAGLGEEAAELAVERLTAAGYMDDGRLARRRASALAARHYGDGAIAARLAAEGIDPASIEEALRCLPSERDRARRAMVELRGSLRQRYAALARRGFGEEALEAAAVLLDGQNGPSLA